MRSMRRKNRWQVQRDEDRLQTALRKISAQAGRGFAIRLEEGRIAVDVSMVALTDDQLCVRDRDVRGDVGARGSLHAVVRPQNLAAVMQRNAVERAFAGMGRSERHVVRRMPILGENHMSKKPGKAIDHRNDLVALPDGQAPARQEGILHVDHEQNAFVVDFISGTYASPARNINLMAVALVVAPFRPGGRVDLGSPWQIANRTRPTGTAPDNLRARRRAVQGA